MSEMISTTDCAGQPPRRAMRIKAAMRAALDARNFNTDGVAKEMGIDGATLRRYLSDSYKGCLPVDQVHGWYQATDGDLSPIRQQLHLCGLDLKPLWEGLGPAPDSPKQAADLSHEAGDLVALLIQQWADGKRTPDERRVALHHLHHLRALCDQMIAADESMTGGK